MIDTVERGTEIKQTEATQSRSNDAFDTPTVRLASSCFPAGNQQAFPIPTARLL